MASTLTKPFTLYPRQNNNGKKIYYVRFRLPDGTRTSGCSTGKTSKHAAEAWANNEHTEGKLCYCATDC